MLKSIAPTKYQESVLAFRDWCGIIDAGGRGAGKSFCMAIHRVDHLRVFGGQARPLVLRESVPGLEELQSRIYEMCVIAFGEATTLNKHSGTITVPSGGVVTFHCLGAEDQYAKIQGRSFTGIFADELGNATPNGFAFTLRTLSNLRVAPGQKPAVHFTMNPHGRAHALCHKRWISKAPPWRPFQDEFGMWWVVCHGTLDDNPHIDKVQYTRAIRASVGQDAALASAWLAGDWNVLSGCLFSFDPKVHIIRRPPYYDAVYRVGVDWGSSSPCVSLLLGRLNSPCGGLRQGDIICLDETDTALPEDLSVGNQAPVQMVCEMVQELCARNNAKHIMCIVDDARGLAGDTVVGEFRRAGLMAQRPTKNRVSGWILINELLHNAREGESGVGLWVTDRCPHLIETIQEAPRGRLRAEDLQPDWNRDHWCDALRYGVSDLFGTKQFKFGRAQGAVGTG